MAISEPYSDNTPIPFGVHRGTKLANVPAGYLLYLWDKSKQGKELSDAKLAMYIKENFHAIELEAKAEKQKRYYERR